MQNAESALRVIARAKFFKTVTAQTKRSAERKLPQRCRSIAKSRAAVGEAENDISFFERMEDKICRFRLRESAGCAPAVKVIIDKAAA